MVIETKNYSINVEPFSKNVVNLPAITHSLFGY